MTFPSRRDRGYRAELARALFWARAWTRSHRLSRIDHASLARVARHVWSAWVRLDAFTGDLLRWKDGP